MKLSKLIFSLVFLTVGFISLNAQEAPHLESPCGVTEKSEWLSRYQAGEFAPVPKFAAFQYVPTRIIIVGDDSGTGYVNHSSILRGLEQFNEDFATADLQFYLSDIEYYNDSDLFVHTLQNDVGTDIVFRESRNGVVNIFFVGQIGSSSTGGTVGYAYPNRNLMVVQNSQPRTGNHTMAHEMGHALSLAHTFYGWENTLNSVDDIDLSSPAPATIRYRREDVQVEKADSSNCTTAADGFCDTAPDYLAIGAWNCNGNVEYRDSLLDPDSTRVAIPAKNFMSYADDNCQATFTQEQLAAMRTNLSLRNDIREDNSGAGAIAAEGADMNLLFPEDGERTEWSNFVELEWNSVPNADFYLVQLNVNRNFGGSVFRNFFTTDTTAVLEEGLVANRRYYWRVRPVNAYLTNSEFGDQIWEFRTGRNAVSSIDPTLDAAITLAPNPVFGGQDLRITGRDLGVSGQLTYEMIDPAGRILLSRENISVAAATGFSERIETAGLPAGVYFLRLRLDDKLVTRRVMVTP